MHRTSAVVVLCCLFPLLGCQQRPASPPPGGPFTWDPFLDTLQERTVRWFLHTADPVTGLIPDRWPTPSPSSIAAVGFGLTAYPIAAENGWMTREDAAYRVLRTLQFLAAIPQDSAKASAGGFKGFYYHFLDMRTGLREWSSELSTIDTGLLLGGVLFCQSYFDKVSATEDSIRRVADSLYRRVDWRWAMHDTVGILMGWKPEEGFHHLTWHGYNEAMILYILALGSPTHPVPPSTWDHWTASYVWAEHYGQTYLNFAPLFGHQYSHLFIDFRGIQDAYMREKGIDYFENSRRATFAQRAYVAENPGGWRAYSDTLWGLSACDGPRDTTLVMDGIRRRFHSYSARGTSVDWTNDDGTLTPTAPGGSLPFAPEICIPALKAMKEYGGDALWTVFGFKDAFNPTFVSETTGPRGWVGPDYLGIDQGPIMMMIENLRTGLIWKTLRNNPYVRTGLLRAGFTGGWLGNQQ